MSSLRYYLIRTLLDGATAIAPKGRAAAHRAESVPECSTSSRSGLDLSGWEVVTIDSPHLGLCHRYYHHPAARSGAPTLLLLHGMFLDGRSFARLRPLAKKYELIAYDFPEEWDGYTKDIDDFVTLLEDFVEQLELESFLLAGVSFGGMVALRWASLLSTTRLRALILLSTRIPGISKRHRQEMSDTNRLLDRYSDDGLFWLQMKGFKLFVRKYRGDQRALVEGAMQPKRICWYRQAFASLEGRDESGPARRIEVPVLYLLGTRDTLIPQSAAEEIQSVIPQSTVELIEGGEHIMTLIEGDEISRRIGAFGASALSVDL